MTDPEFPRSSPARAGDQESAGPAGCLAREERDETGQPMPPGDDGLVAGDDGSVVPLADGLPDVSGQTLRDVDPAFGRRDVTGAPALGRDPDNR